MKVLLAALVLFTASLSFAKEVVVFEFSNYSFSYGVNSSFAVNEEMGRAWVEIEVVEDTNYSQSSRKYYARKFEGLSYNEALQAVVYENDGQLVECAKVRHGGRIFRGLSVKATGNCKFNHRYVKVPYDDGYRTGTTSVLQEYMTVE